MQQQMNFQSWSSGRTSQERSVATTVPTLRKSSGKWLNWGQITLSGPSSTQSTLECPNQGAESLSSLVLMENVPERYFLSKRAAEGVIRRAQGCNLAPEIEACCRAIIEDREYRPDVFPFLIMDIMRVGDVRTSDRVFPCLVARMGTGGNNVPLVTVVIDGLARIRKLMPIEVERVMGWPDDSTRYRKDGSEVSDTQRYKMLGNGVVSPVAKWIAEQIDICCPVKDL